MNTFQNNSAGSIQHDQHQPNEPALSYGQRNGNHLVLARLAIHNLASDEDR
jgi:hypothetical protein